MGVVLRCLRFGLVIVIKSLRGVGVFLPEEVVTVTVVMAEDDGTVEKPVGIGTGTGTFAVEETVTVLSVEADEAAAGTVEVTVLWLAADEESEGAAPTVDVTVLWLAPDEDPEAAAPTVEVTVL